MVSKPLSFAGELRYDSVQNARVLPRKLRSRTESSLALQQDLTVLNPFQHNLIKTWKLEFLKNGGNIPDGDKGQGKDEDNLYKFGRHILLKAGAAIDAQKTTGTE